MDSDQPTEKKFLKKIAITLGLVFLFSLSVFLFVIAYRIILLAFGGILFAVLLDGGTDFISKHLKLTRNWAFFLSLLIFIISITVLIWLVGPPIVEQITKLAQQLPEAIEKLRISIVETSIGRQVLERASSGISSIGKESLSYFTDFFSSTFSFITDILIILILGIYFAATPQLYIDNIRILFPKKQQKEIKLIFHHWGKALKWWLVGRFSSMIVVAVLTGIGLWIAGMDLALSFAIIAGVLSFIPFIGPFISFIPPFLMSFVQSSSMALYVVVVYVFVQTLESYLITPLIEKRVVSLPPALVIIMQILMGVIFGTLGILFASPIAVIIIILIQILYIRNYLGEEVELLSDT